MVATIEQIIGKINPKLYAENGEELLKDYKTIDKIPADKVKPKYASYMYSFPEGVVPTKGMAGAIHKLVYDSTSETLEPVYFWLLDLIDLMKMKTEKLIDNFSSTVGSGHFSELGQRATIMQQQASKLLGDINTVLRSVLNIVYDLKEFKIRLQSYQDLKDKNKKESAILSLKQVWLDKVDAQKGNSSIKGMALTQAGFQTLLDAFLVAKDEKDAENIDLNDRVKRIVKSRIAEFNIWLKNSEEELKKRYELERDYLKSQVNSLKIYARWAKPYLKAANELEQKDQSKAIDFVKAFNTIILELVLLGKSGLNPKDLAIERKLPDHFIKYDKNKRTYHACALLEFRFRGIPSRIAQQAHYSFGGRVEISFKAYALNDDELAMLKQELDNSDLTDALKLAQGATEDSLEKMQEEINQFLEEKTIEEKETEDKNSKDINPFMALIGKTEKKKEEKIKEKENKKITEIKPDDWYEKNYLRPLAEATATNNIFSLFDIYKKGHQMASYA